MGALAVVGIFVLAGLTVFVIAISGGPGQAREKVLHSQSRRGRRTVTIIVGVIFLGFGIAIPTLVIAHNKDRNNVPPTDIKLTAAQKRGRELFGHTCNQCHTLAAAHTVGTIGPNLDDLKPPKALVLDAVLHGRARGNGRMPAALLQGRDAEDVADFVSAVAGKQ